MQKALISLKSLYTEYPRQFWLVASGVLLSSAGSSLIWPFQLIYISKILKLPLTEVAVLITISSLTGLVVSIAGGSIADRFGRKPIMFIAQAAHGLAYILMSSAHTYTGFLIPMTIMGAMMPFYAIGSDAMMADLIPSDKRTGAYAILRMINNAGIAIGPAIGGTLIAAYSYTIAFYGAASGMIVFSILLLLFARETLARQAHTPQTRSQLESLGGYALILKDRSFMLFTTIVTIGMIAPLLLWTLLAVYTNKYFGLPEDLYRWLPITNALMCVFVQYPITSLTRKYRANLIIAIGMLTYAIGVGSVAIMSTFPGFWLSMVIMTCGELILIPTASKYVADLAPEAMRGRYMSIYWLTWGLARGVAPLLGGFLHDRITPVAIWWGGLILGLSSSLCLFYLAAQKPRTVSEAIP